MWKNNNWFARLRENFNLSDLDLLEESLPRGEVTNTSKFVDLVGFPSLKDFEQALDFLQRQLAYLVKRTGVRPGAEKNARLFIDHLSRDVFAHFEKNILPSLREEKSREYKTKLKDAEAFYNGKLKDLEKSSRKNFKEIGRIKNQRKLVISSIHTAIQDFASNDTALDMLARYYCKAHDMENFPYRECIEGIIDNVVNGDYYQLTNDQYKVESPEIKKHLILFEIQTGKKCVGISQHCFYKLSRGEEKCTSKKELEDRYGIYVFNTLPSVGDGESASSLEELSYLEAPSRADAAQLHMFLMQYSTELSADTYEFFQKMADKINEFDLGDIHIKALRVARKLDKYYRDKYGQTFFVKEGTIYTKEGVPLTDDVPGYVKADVIYVFSTSEEASDPSSLRYLPIQVKMEEGDPVVTFTNESDKNKLSNFLYKVDLNKLRERRFLTLFLRAGFRSDYVLVASQNWRNALWVDTHDATPQVIDDAYTNAERYIFIKYLGRDWKIRVPKNGGRIRIVGV